MKRVPGSRLRTTALIAFTSVIICSAVFVPMGISAARKGIIKSLDVEDISGFSIRMKATYQHLLRLKSQNDNIDYIFYIMPFVLNKPQAVTENESPGYDEISICAVYLDEYLLGSSKKEFLYRGEMFGRMDMIRGNRVIMLNKDHSEKRKSIRLCPDSADMKCVDFNVIGYFKDVKKIGCDGLIPASSISLFGGSIFATSTSSHVYGSVKDPGLAEETVKEIIAYLMEANKEYGVVYGINATKFEETVKSLNRLTTLSFVIFILLLFSASFGIADFVYVETAAKKLKRQFILCAVTPGERWH